MLNYTNAFFAFWCALAGATVAISFVGRERDVSCYEQVFFWAFSMLMVAFVAVRPFGLALDDQAYLRLYEGVCPTLVCGQWMQSSRDWGWYSLVGLLKSVVSTPRVMLCISASALLIKLWVINRLCRYPLPALLLFAVIFYQIQDITAWRVALSLAFFMIAFWLLIKNQIFSGLIASIFCGFFHKQAFVAPLMLFGRFIGNRYWIVPVFVAVPIGLMLLGFYPRIHEIYLHLSNAGVLSIATNKELDPYFGAQQIAELQHLRIVPIVFWPFLSLAILLNWDSFKIDNTLFSYTASCIIIACWFLWVAASTPVVQVRFFEFFMMPTVVLAGLTRLDGLRLAVVVGVSGIFVIKYNVIAHIFLI